MTGTKTDKATPLTLETDADLETDDERVLRQSSIATTPNPIPQTDYLCHLSGKLTSSSGQTITVELRYVPDKWILLPDALADYLHALAPPDREALELTASLVIDDLNNQLVARWLQITMSGPPEAATDITAHRILLEDRQPQWDNPALLQRIAGF
ncbi:hypothetical protein EOI86_04325 [Hwanghaeella grinnelliae]|uniref:Uncharacterized protein n=1 Tax=Hwanghaeella grinnelliae TaxID=2500179 RepID=A0A3S2WU44_9PROT|nr:hypothetical protein [Hwanghaeella grinnelliae]RVU38517.1 hypothetical protein EOI86_04325 [Hwanghaeella grinnelliae]